MHDSDRRDRVLAAIGVQSWRLRGADNDRARTIASERRPDKGEHATAQTPSVDVAAGLPVSELDWDTLQKRVAVCTACPLHKGRTQTVFGTGSHAASWLLVGEAPGDKEDLSGEPFVGPSGKLLNAMIRAVGAQREQVYITNIVKCRPPSDRNPRADESASCAPFLQRQIELLKPKLILAVGKVAAGSLLNSDLTMAKLRGQVYEYGERKIPLVATYHPAYLLRKPSEKGKAWADLRLAMSVAPAAAD